MKPIKHRKTSYLIIVLLMLAAYLLYVKFFWSGFLTTDHDYIPYCIGSLGIAAIFFVKMKGRV